MRNDTSALATDRQVRYIAKLATAAGVALPEEQLTKAAASVWIDHLLASAPQPERANRYAGSCGRCRGAVPAETGRIEKVDGRWITYHLTCPETPEVSAPTPEVPEGRYAFTADEGHTAFAKVDHGKNRWEGCTFVSLLIGSPGDFREQRMSRAAAASILEKILADGPTEAMARFGHEVGQCGRCASPLTDPESIARGIGPVCFGRMGG